uniref:ATP synthase complex subunit 8 n=1 Tax=Isometopus sp. TaxID=2931297 RepID=A0A8T9ZYG4_9HEMI|nr:ATPase subunit 8 [Isometopus sp.]
MPQMAPMWWTMLFMSFIIMFMLYNTLMYFYNIYETKTKTTTKSSTKNMNWKW